ncbi:MAG: Bax inhibitor-1/YccA family membrane protein [Limisphaerales bacterium]
MFLYATRIVRVTDKLVMGIMIATGAIAVVYLIEFVLRFFGISMPYMHESGPMGIGVSLIIVGVAAFNLLIDFAVIESNVRQGSPKYMEWYSGMALLVTLVWLYLEVLRLLSKLRDR